MFESRISVGATEKLLGWKKPHAKTVAWSYLYGRSREKGASNDFANSLDDELQEERVGSGWRIVIMYAHKLS